MRIVLDSDVIIECLRGNATVTEKLKQLYLSATIISYTPISSAEIYAGVRENERRKVKYFFDNLNFLPIDDEAGVKAGDYLRKFSKSHNVEIADALIAASAFINKAKLYTHNKKHYPMSDIELL